MYHNSDGCDLQMSITFNFALNIFVIINKFDQNDENLLWFWFRFNCFPFLFGFFIKIYVYVFFFLFLLLNSLANKIDAVCVVCFVCFIAKAVRPRFGCIFFSFIKNIVIKLIFIIFVSNKHILCVCMHIAHRVESSIQNGRFHLYILFFSIYSF